MPFPPVAGLPPGTQVTGSVDFDNIKVDWNRYELPNGVTLCLAALPTAIYLTNAKDPKGMPAYLITWSNVLRVIAPENLTGTPSPPLQAEQLKRSPSTIVKPLTTSEPWSEFGLKDGHTVRLRLIVTEIRRITNAFDSTGMPLFTLNSQTVVDVSDSTETTGE